MKSTARDVLDSARHLPAQELTLSARHCQHLLQFTRSLSPFGRRICSLLIHIGVTKSGVSAENLYLVKGARSSLAFAQLDRVGSALVQRLRPCPLLVSTRSVSRRCQSTDNSVIDFEHFALFIQNLLRRRLIPDPLFTPWALRRASEAVPDLA